MEVIAMLPPLVRELIALPTTSRLKFPFVVVGDCPYIALPSVTVHVGVRVKPLPRPVCPAYDATTLFTAAGTLETVSELGLLTETPKALDATNW